jgi:dihydroxyacetone kinase-like protein
MGKCTHPQNGALLCDLPDGIMEIGMGQHGEGGGGRGPLVSADDTAEQMLSLLLKQLKLQKGDQVFLIINGVGASTHMELFIVFRKAYQLLTAQGIDVVDGRVEEILTVQEENGFQMIIGKLDPDHVELLKNRKADTPYWTTIGK